jgi:hypothetical protein
LTRPFTWTAIPGAQAYYLYVGTRSGPATGEHRRDPADSVHGP